MSGVIPQAVAHLLRRDGQDPDAILSVAVQTIRTGGYLADLPQILADVQVELNSDLASVADERARERLRNAIQAVQDELAKRGRILH